MLKLSTKQSKLPTKQTLQWIKVATLKKFHTAL